MVDKIAGADLWSTKRVLRHRLVEDARRRMRRSWQERGAASAELGWIEVEIGVALQAPAARGVLQRGFGLGLVPAVDVLALVHGVLPARRPVPQRRS